MRASSVYTYQPSRDRPNPAHSHSVLCLITYVPFPLLPTPAPESTPYTGANRALAVTKLGTEKDARIPPHLACLVPSDAGPISLAHLPARLLFVYSTIDN